MSSFSTFNAYEKRLEKYRDINEDEILSSLTAEELERLDVSKLNKGVCCLKLGSCFSTNPKKELRI